MKGEYQSYFPNFEANQVLTSTHLNELRNYLDEQNRLTRSQLIGVGVACGLTFELGPGDKPGERHVCLFEGLGVTSEGYFISFKGEEEKPKTDRLGLGSYSVYTKFRLYKDPSPDKYWFYGPDDAPLQVLLFQLLTDEDAEQLQIDGEAEAKDILPITDKLLADKVLLLYLEQNDVALKSCTGNDCDNRGSKRHLSVKVLVTNRGPAKKINEPECGIEIPIVNLDGMLIRTPAAKVLKAPRFIAGINKNGTPLQGIKTFPPIGRGYQRAIEKWKLRLAEHIDSAYKLYGPFLGLSEKDLNQLNVLRNMVFKLETAQYALDFIKELTRAYNEFVCLSYELKRDCCNDDYEFCRHLMLGTVKPDNETRKGDYDKFRNYFVRFGLTWAQGERLRMAQLMFRRMLLMIKGFEPEYIGNFGQPNVQHSILPSQEDEYALGKGAIPEYYNKGRNLETLVDYWDPERTLKDLEDEILSYNPNSYSDKDHVRNPFDYDIDPDPFFRIRSVLGLDLDKVLDKFAELKVKHNLAFDVVAVRLGDKVPDNDLRATLDKACFFGDLQADFTQLRAALDRVMVVGNDRHDLFVDVAEITKRMLLPVDIIKDFFVQTDVVALAQLALSVDNLFEFVVTPEGSISVFGKVPQDALSSYANLFDYAYGEYRRFALYFISIVRFRLDEIKRTHPDACDRTELENERSKLEAVLDLWNAFLADTTYLQLQALVAEFELRIQKLRTGHPMLFHNFATLNPGLEHLGGVYKGGTFVLVYEDQTNKRKAKDDLELVEDVKEVVKGDGEVRIKKAADTKSGEFEIDEALNPDLEDEEFKKALIEKLGSVEEGALTEGDKKLLEDSTTESLFGNYVHLMNEKSGGELTLEEEKKLEEKFKEEVRGLTTDTTGKEIPEITKEEYIESIGNESKLEIVLGGERLLPEDGGLVLEEPRASSPMAELLVTIIEQLDRGFLTSRDFLALRGTDVPLIWRTYLSMVARVLERKLTPEAIAELTAEYVKRMESISSKELDSRGISLKEWSAYIAAIKAGDDLGGGQEPAVFMDFLLSELVKFSEIKLTVQNLESLRKQPVEKVWPAYLNIFAFAIGERSLSIAEKRELTTKFIGHMKRIDPAIVNKQGLEKEFGSFMLSMDAYLKSLEDDGGPVTGNENEALMKVLVARLKTLRYQKLAKIDGPELDPEIYEKLTNLEPKELWDAYTTALQRKYGEIPARFLDELKREYIDILKATDPILIVKAGIQEKFEAYIKYLEETLDDGPTTLEDILRTELIGCLRGLKVEALTEKDYASLESVSVDNLWPEFLRMVFRVKGGLFTKGEAEELKTKYLDCLLGADRVRLRDLGIEKLWYEYISKLVGDDDVDPVDPTIVLVNCVVDTMRDCLQPAIGKQQYQDLRQLPPESIFNSWLFFVEQNTGKKLSQNEKDKFRAAFLRCLQKVDPGQLEEKKIKELFEAYIEQVKKGFGDQGAPVERKIVADFSLPYICCDDCPEPVLPGEIADQTVVLPPVTGFDSTTVVPGGFVEVRVLNNDFDPNTGQLTGSPEFVVEITDVLQPEGALGGTAGLVKTSDNAFHTIRYTSNPGSLVREAEIVEIRYRVLNRRTFRSATGTLLVLVREALKPITDPCCCCEDYSFVVKKNEDLVIDEVARAFLPYKPFLVRLVLADDKLGTVLDTRNFRAVVGPKQQITVVSKGDFEGTVRFEYQVDYYSGDASCRGTIEVHVVCECQTGPPPVCETHFNADAATGVIVDTMLSDEEVKRGYMVMFNVGDKPEKELLAPPAGIDSGKISEDATAFLFNVGVSASGQIAIPYYVGQNVAGDFEIIRECTLYLNVSAMPCASTATAEAGKSTVISDVLTLAEIDAGTILHFEEKGQPVPVLRLLPIGAEKLVLTDVPPRNRKATGFGVVPAGNFTGDIVFNYYKGTIVGERFIPSQLCTMTITVKRTELCIVEREIEKNTSALLADLLTAEQVKAGIRISFLDDGVPTQEIPFLPRGAAKVGLTSDSQFGSTPATAMFMSPIKDFAGVIEWEFAKIDTTTKVPTIVETCLMRVTVKGVERCTSTGNIQQGEEKIFDGGITSAQAKEGLELRFVVDNKYTTTHVPLPGGADLCKLVTGAEGKPTSFRVIAKADATGDIVFNYARGVLDKRGGFIPRVLCTYTIAVKPSEKCEHTVDAFLGREFTVENILSREDITGGMRLRFLDANGNPTEKSTFGALAQLIATSVSGVPNTGFRLRIDSSKLATVTMPFMKGIETRAGFIGQQVCSLIITLSEPAPFCEERRNAFIGKELVINDLLTAEEVQAGARLFLLEGEIKTDVLKTMPLGAARLTLNVNERLFPDFTVMRFLSTEKPPAEVVFDYVKSIPTGKVSINIRCTMRITMQVASEKCETLATAKAGEATLLEPITSEDIKAGMQLTFNVDGNPSATLKTLPAGVEALDLVSDREGLIQNGAFRIAINASHTGEIRFDYFRIDPRKKPVETPCTMIITVTPSDPQTELCQHAATCPASSSVVIGDILTLKEISAGMQLRFMGKAGPTTVLSPLPIGAEAISLDAGQNGPNTAIKFSHDGSTASVVTFRYLIGSFNGKIFTTMKTCTMTVNILRGDGDIKLPDGDIKLPDGDIKLPDGDIKLPDGDIKLPDGDVKLPDGDVKLPDGDVKLPEGDVKLPDGDVKLPEGDVRLPEEDVKLPEGDVRLPDGGLDTRLPDGGLEVRGPEFTLDRGFETSKFYNPADRLQAEVIGYLENTEKIFTDSKLAGSIRTTTGANTAADSYGAVMGKLSDRIMGTTSFHERNYYLRLYALSLDAGFQTASLRDDIRVTVGFKPVFDQVTSQLGQFKTAGYYQPGVTTDRIDIALNSLSTTGKTNLDGALVQMKSI